MTRKLLQPGCVESIGLNDPNGDNVKKQVTFYFINGSSVEICLNDPDGEVTSERIVNSGKKWIALGSDGPISVNLDLVTYFQIEEIEND